MKTIAFYSYKGGTSRSLLLANYARYLARCGKSVIVLDFDLEAPGLHHKFLESGDLTNDEWEANREIAGLQEYLRVYEGSSEDPTKREAPSYLRKYFLKLEFKNSTRACYFMPAGNAPTIDYVSRHLSRNWKEYFPKDNNQEPSGLNMFLNLRNRIEDEFEADFLLIDSRTGITDIGTTSILFLPNKAVCLFLSNTESIKGTRLMLETIRKINSNPEISIEALPVLSRIPENVLEQDEALNKAKKELGDLFDKDNAFILHEQMSLHVSEELLFGSNRALRDSILLRDYFRIFYALDKQTANESIYSQFQGLLNKELSIPADLIGKDTFSINVSQNISDRELEQTNKRKKGKYLLHAGRYISNAPISPSISDRETIETSYSEIKKNMEYGYTDGKPYERLVSLILRNLIKQITDQDSTVEKYEEPVSEKNINWDLLGMQIGTKFDFCSELYYLTEYRGLYLDVVQLGWLNTFTCFVKKHSKVRQAIKLEWHKGQIKNAIEKAKNVVGKNLEVCLMGESAAADAAIKVISKILSGDNLIFERNVSKLWNWINVDGDNNNERIIVCDHSVALKINQFAKINNLDSEFDFAIKDDQNSDFVFNFNGETEKNMKQAIPVGFLYPKWDREWRYMINNAVAGAILAEPDIWDGSKCEGNVKNVLMNAGIKPFEWQELLDYLLIGMRPDDAAKWLKDINKINKEHAI